MRTFILAAFAAFIGLILMDRSDAEAGKRCPAHITRDACEVWLRQQNAPALRGPKAPSEPVRCVAVLSDQPSALVLREGYGNRGPTVISWRAASLSWKHTGRGYETTICFPKRYVGRYDALTLCGAIGHSAWGPPHMAYLQKRNVGSHDPACVGGKAWCAKRGL